MTELHDEFSKVFDAAQERFTAYTTFRDYINLIPQNVVIDGKGCPVEQLPVENKIRHYGLFSPYN